MSLRACTFSALSALLVCFLAPVSAAQVIEREGKSHIAFSEEGDLAMDGAVEAARATLRHFWDQLSKATSVDDVHMLKIGLPTLDGRSEFIWIYPTDYNADSEEYEGVLMNEPFNLAGNLKIGDLVSFFDEQIVDWSYYEGEQRRGEFTTRVLISNMSPEDAASYDGMLHLSPLP